MPTVAWADASRANCALAGVIARWAAFWRRRRPPSVPSRDSYRGLLGVATTPITRAQPGEVKLTTPQGDEIWVHAVTIDEHPIEKGAEVVVVVVTELGVLVTQLPAFPSFD